VRELHALADSAGVPFEIICLDDGSRNEFLLLNAGISDLRGVKYSCLGQNIGRSAIRNLLADESKYEYLLFMDSDFKITHPGYIKRYLEARKKQQVVVGGSLYAPSPPPEPDLLLRWRYGSKREQLSLERRQRLGWKAFTTHHFLVHREAFSRVRFDESLRQYGHEDTLFGQALEREGYKIRHIGNPLLHQELDPAGIFLEKVLQSVENLYRLQLQGVHLSTSLGRAFAMLHSAGLDRLVGRSFQALGPILKRQLIGPNPHLWALDLYKLLYYSYLNRFKQISPH